MKFWHFLIVLALAGFGLGLATVFVFASLGAPVWTALFAACPIGWYLGRGMAKSIVFD